MATPHLVAPAHPDARFADCLLAVGTGPGPLEAPLQERFFLAPPACSFEYQSSPRYFVRAVIEVCRAIPELLRRGSVPRKEPAPIIKDLIAWRNRNQLSRRQAAAVLQRHGCPVTASTLRVWEAGGNPRELLAKALAKVLKEHRTVTDPPRFGRWVNRK